MDPYVAATAAAAAVAAAVRGGGFEGVSSSPMPC
jgi:hypothetical protein